MSADLSAHADDGTRIFDTALVGTVTVDHGLGRLWHFKGKDSEFTLVPAVRLSFGDDNSRSVVVISREQWESLKRGESNG